MEVRIGKVKPDFSRVLVKSAITLTIAKVIGGRFPLAPGFNQVFMNFMEFEEPF